MLEFLNSKGCRGPFLVVAPVSTLEQWRREVESWTDLNCVLYHGSVSSRDIIRKCEWRFANSKKYKQLYKFQILLVSYQTILSDMNILSKIKWQYLIVDEGHRLKNTKSKLFESLQSFHTEHRLVLTGTPLQNNIQELWAILNFVDPEKFYDPDNFEKQYGNLKDSRHRKRLHKILSAYLLRRLKEDVFKSLPIKEETIIETELTAIQKRFYKAILERNREFLCKGVKSSNVPSLINIMVELRKCCNHPFLIKGAEEKILNESSKYVETLIHSSSKLIILDKLLSKLRTEGHQVLIFSQMTQLLNILEDYLNEKNYPFERLDGSVNLTNRQAAIDRFSNKENDNFVFLLSTRAGGLGLNLTAANTAVIFDSDWNPQNDLQAQARCHRIGQTENVKIYRLVTKNTYEEYMLSVASKKLGLEMVVLASDENSGSINGGAKSLDKKEVDHLLKYGAYHLFNSSEEEDQDEEKKLISEDINSILDRATTLKYDETDQETDKPLSNLSKVTYQIDIESENYWDSVLPEHKTAPKLLKQLKKNKENEFSKKETRDQFIKDLHAVVEDIQETLENRSKSYAFSSQAPVMAVSNLIDAIINSDLFTAEEKEPLYVLQNSIVSTKRERKTVDRTLLEPTTNFVDKAAKKLQKKQQQHEASAAAAAEAKKEADLKKETEWTKNLRDRVKNALVSLGPGRWKEISNFVFSSESSTEKRSKSANQIRSLCESMIQQYFGREDIGDHKLVALKEDDAPFPKNHTSFYGKWIQGESEKLCNSLISHYRKHKLKKTNNMRNDWSKVTISIEGNSFDSPSPQKPKKSSNSTTTPSSSDEPDYTFEPGQRVSLVFNNLPPSDSESAIPVFIIIRLISDDKKEGVNCIVRAHFIEPLASPLRIYIPGYVGIYRIQFWCPLWTKHPNVNTKKGPYTTIRVNCPDVLESITRFASQRYITQCEFMKSLEKLVFNSNKMTRPQTKLPIWWWNESQDDDVFIMKGIYKHGYSRFSAIRSDLEYDDEALKKRLQSVWDKKSAQEKKQLGYVTNDSSPSNTAAASAAANSKKKLKDNPFEFPSTTAINTHIKHFLKANNLLDTETSQVPPKIKLTKSGKPLKKRKPQAKKPVQTQKRDSSPENFVKKKITKKRRNPSTPSPSISSSPSTSNL